MASGKGCQLSVAVKYWRHAAQEAGKNFLFQANIRTSKKLAVLCRFDEVKNERFFTFFVYRRFNIIFQKQAS
jgi:hypothetical protein